MFAVFGGFDGTLATIDIVHFDHRMLFKVGKHKSSDAFKLGMKTLVGRFPGIRFQQFPVQLCILNFVSR